MNRLTSQLYPYIVRAFIASCLLSLITLMGALAATNAFAKGSTTHLSATSSMGVDRKNQPSAPLNACTTDPVVTNINDSGSGSLRDVMTNACPGSTISFDPSLTSNGTATITLLTALPDISSNLTITGPGSNLLTIQRSFANGTPKFRIFYIYSGTTVSISGLSVSNGNISFVGGGLVNSGTLHLSNMIISGNNADTAGGGIGNGGTLTITNSTISGNQAIAINGADGGGIYNSGNLTITNSTISNNSSITGAGIIHNSSMTLTIINSTISNNSSQKDGGGIWSTGYTTTAVVATNCTITGNRANLGGDGGGGGGIKKDYGTFTLNNSIVAGNYRGASNTPDDIQGNIDKASNDLIGDTGTSGGITNGVNGNRVGNSGSGTINIDTVLNTTLANNGGPTQTHLLLPGSPAINAGDNSLAMDADGNALTTDQRGPCYRRVVNSTVDIGAVEVSDFNYCISATTGAVQSAIVNKTFSTQLQATVTESGTPKSGIAVTFTAPASGASGTFAGGNASVTVMTDSSGVATAPAFTANGTAGGPYNVIASLNGGVPSIFSLTNLRGLAQVNISNLAQTYDGTQKSVTVTTNPPGLNVVITYDNSTTPPINAGSYAVVATVNDAGYSGIATSTLVISKATATVTLGNLIQTYDGTVKNVTATTTPSNLNVSISYSHNGLSVQSSINAGSYNVTATVNDSNYQGSAIGTLVINKASAIITLNNLNQTYNGFTKFATATTNPIGIAGVSIIYSQNGTAVTSPINAGSYDVVASLNNSNYQASNVTGTLVISKGTATIFLGNLTQTYSGIAKSVSVSTSPFGLNVTVAYSQNGQPVTSPTDVGSYNVTATINDANYQGSQTGILVINKATPVITWNTPANIIVGTPLSSTQLNATATVPGTFTYTPPAGTVLSVGNNQLSATFTPTDTSNYTTATKTVRLIVDPVRIQFSQTSYSVGEGDGRATITVSRSDSTSAASVNYATSDTLPISNTCQDKLGIASARCDYATTIGTLQFAVGESSKTISIPIVDDAIVEGPETFSITLSNPVGAVLGSLSSATITITDNDSAPGANPTDTASFFVRQHYIDFLGREADANGATWESILNNCPASGVDSNGNHCDRIEVSGDFFRSEEFQTRGYFIYRFYKVLPSVSDPNNPQNGHLPHYSEFMPDFARVSGALTPEQLEANKVVFINNFMARSEYQTTYASINDPTAYVNVLLLTVGLPNHPTRQTWIDSLTNGTMTKAQVLRALIESAEMYQKYYNEAFVIMQYFGYLRRDADLSYQQWLQTMNSTNGDYRTMINGFLNSTEYRQRFGP